MTANITFPALLQAFFTDRLLQQKQVSPHTIASYRDTFCLLLRYLALRTSFAGLVQPNHCLQYLIRLCGQHLERLWPQSG